MQNPRYVAFKALQKLENDNGYSNLILDSFLKNAELEQRDCAFVSSLFYGVIERKLSLDYIISQFSTIPLRKVEKSTLNILRLGVFQLVFMNKIPDSAAVNESVKLCKKAKLFSSSGFVNAVLRNISRAENRFPLPSEDNITEYLSVKYSCPQDIVEMWTADYSMETAESTLEALLGRPPIYIRVNTLKTTPHNLIEELARDGVQAYSTVIDTALELRGVGAVSELPSFKRGLFHVQDLSSQICCSLLDVKSGCTVTDVCAAPGGKTFTAAQSAGSDVKVFSYDLHSHKLKLIEDGAKRLGITTITARCRDAMSDAPLEMSDRILCDVPCSGLGILRRKPEIRYKSDTGVESLPDIQYNILLNSAKYVKSGGILVYSTCTLHRAENGDIADRFLSENKEFSPCVLNIPKGISRTVNEPSNQLTLFPQTNNTDGFFISAFIKR